MVTDKSTGPSPKAFPIEDRGAHLLAQRDRRLEVISALGIGSGLMTRLPEVIHLAGKRAFRSCDQVLAAAAISEHGFAAEVHDQGLPLDHRACAGQKSSPCLSVRPGALSCSGLVTSY